MESFLWVIIRFALVALFALCFAKAPFWAGSTPLTWVSAAMDVMTVPLVAWLYSSTLRTLFKSKRRKGNWSASLWTSPILRNPESFFAMGGAAFVAGGLLGFVAVRFQTEQLGFSAMLLALGCGMLIGWLRFRMKWRKEANHVPQPTPDNGRG